MNRTISFHINGTDPTNAIAVLLLGLTLTPPGDSGHFDPQGPKSTAVWRLPDGTGWGVSFRPTGGNDSRTRYYRNPLDAARAIVERRHNEHSYGRGMLPAAADTGCAGLTPAPG